MQSGGRVIRAALIWHEGALAEGWEIGVSADRITSIGRAGDHPDGAVEDWGDVAILPGTVNAHGHAFQNLLKGFGDDRPFHSWRDDVLYPFSEHFDGEAIYVAALFAFAEALAAGVTTTVDFFYLHDNGNANAELVVKAARDIGIRLVLARAFYDVDAPTRAPGRYRESASDALDRVMALARSHADDPLLSIQPAPHSLHAACPATIAMALDAARELDVPCHLHLAEASYERMQIEERYGSTPVRLLAAEGLLDRRLVCIHTVWVDDEELDLLAESGCGVVHCPGANAFLGDGMARVPEMLERGIHVALGPDGGCANNRQSVFDEMRMASLVAKARLADGSALDATTVLGLGTSGGADLLSLDAGRLSPGSLADLVALDLTDLSLQPRVTLERQIVHSMQATAIARVMVGGEIVFADGRHTRVDASDLRARIDAVTGRWPAPS